MKWNYDFYIASSVVLIVLKYIITGLLNLINFHGEYMDIFR